MVQNIDIKYQDEVRSKPINQRFLDITSPGIIKGYDLELGTNPFMISLTRGIYNESSAITPSGVKVSETENLIDVLQIRPNDTTEYRQDAVFLKYVFGRYENVAEYVVVEGIGTRTPINPNTGTHLLLGSVRVPPNRAAITQASLIQEKKGVRIPRLAGPSNFEGDMIINGNLTVVGDLNSVIGGDIQATFIEKMPNIINVERNQTTFRTHKPYIMMSNSLFVYVNSRLLHPDEVVEIDPQNFGIVSPLKEGDKVWAFWFLKMQFIKTEAHDHDDLYYRKHEIDRMTVKSFKGKFNGNTGTVVPHTLGTDNYSVVGVVATTKNSNLGIVSVVKQNDSVTVFNTGEYRGDFDISLKLDSDNPLENGIGDVFKVAKSDYDTTLRQYKTTKRYRRDGSLHSETKLMNKGSNGYYSTLTLNLFAVDGTTIIQTRTWQITYSTNGAVVGWQRTV